MNTIKAITLRNNKLKLLLTPFILIGIIFASLAFAILFQYRSFENIIDLPLERMVIGFGEAILVVFFYNFLIRKLNILYPWKRNWFIRSLIDFGIVTIFPTIVITVINYALHAGWIADTNEEYRMFIYIMPLLISALFMVVVEMIVATEERNHLEVKLALAEKEQINSKYCALKGQLDHHFLFNNLSVLSSIIYESTEKADQFIQDFASIYRYVLSINKQDLVSIKEELNFIDTYLTLYKYRFEDGFDYHLDINEKAEACSIPPLSLQVVVENVFKHNVISRLKPLKLSISVENDTLVIKNNMQAKTDKVESTKTGQSNLIEKFKLLNCDLPTFSVETDFYIVRIPLIQTDDDRSINR